MTDKTSKKPLQSKTIWFNLLTLVGVSLAAVSNHEIVVENPLLVGGITVVSSLVNVALRFVTKDPIE